MGLQRVASEGRQLVSGLVPTAARLMNAPRPASRLALAALLRRPAALAACSDRCLARRCALLVACSDGCVGGGHQHWGGGCLLLYRCLCYPARCVVCLLKLPSPLSRAQTLSMTAASSELEDEGAYLHRQGTTV